MSHFTATITPLTQVIDALEAEDLSQVSAILAQLAPAEIARMLESLPPTERERVWEHVADKDNGNVLAHLSESVLIDLVDDMSHEELLRMANTMDEDDLVDFLQDLPDATALKLMNGFDQLHRERLATLIDYDEDSAGGMMNTDTISVRANITIEALVRYLRRKESLPDITNKIFVIDRQGVLQGEVLLTKLFTYDDQVQIASIMNHEPVTLSPNTSSEQVARLFREKDLVSVAVVNEQQQLIGRITVDDVIDFIQEENERVLMQTAGMDEETDTFAPIHKAATTRGIWLGVNMFTALLTASIINAFGATIEQIVALAALAPMAASLGGNAGAQTLTVIIRGIALGHIEGANAGALIMRELLIGLINASVWGMIAGSIAYIWFGNLSLSFVMFAALFINLITAATVGAITPLLLKKLNIDPALAGSILLMTFTDMIGFLALLGLASVFLL